MEFSEALAYSFDEIRQLVHGTVDGLHRRALLWRPDDDANSIAWLVWHLTRVADDHVSEIAGRQQVWPSDGWAARFGLPPGYADTGYGHASDDVAGIAPPDADVLVQYHDAVARATIRDVKGLTPDDFDRIIDRSYDPPVTVGVRLLSVIGDCYQHAGQAAYVRGMYRRMT